MEVPETIVTVLAVAAFVISLFIAARLTKLDWRTAWILMVVNIVIGLIAFSALTAFPLFSRDAIGALAPAKQVAIAPLILVFELLVGTYLASRILGLEFLRSLKFILATLCITIIISSSLRVLFRALKSRFTCEWTLLTLATSHLLANASDNELGRPPVR